MAPPAIVLLILLAGDADDPATAAVLPALRRPLGDDAVVLVEQAPAPPTDAETLALAREVKAFAAATVAWDDPAHEHVHVRVFRVEGSQRYEYDLAFAPDDALPERGRATGLALAPLLMQARTGDLPASAPPASAPPAGAAAPAPQPVPPPVPAPAPPIGAEARPAVNAARQRTSDRPWAVDLSGVGSVGIGGDALGVGPAVGVRWTVWGPLALHAIGLARFGEVRGVGASSAIAGGGGVVWTIARIGGAGIRGVGVAARADLMAMRLAVVRTASGPSLTRERWLTAGSVLVEGEWPFADPVRLALSAGAEVVAGSTAVTVGGESVDHIPELRVVGELGVRARF